MSQQIRVYRKLEFLGAGTGVLELVMPTGLADALSVKRGTTDVIVFDTTTPAITITPATTITGAVTLNGGLTIAGGTNIVLSATTGTKIGTGTTQLLGFYNATPVVQGAGVADATDATTVITQCNALISRIEATGLIATV